MDAETGNVGIGPTTPTAMLEVESTSEVNGIWSTTSAIPVYGHRISTTGMHPGVYGKCDSLADNASGVLGYITSTSPGAYSAGVYGRNWGTGATGIGVRGSHEGSGYGVYGFAPSGRGVVGDSNDGVGVYGYSANGYAGRFNGTVSVNELEITDGSQGVGKVLTSDADGVASWQTPGAPGSVYRWATFSTYDNNDGWLMGNNSDLFGGIPPSHWTDNNAQASQLSEDKEVLRALFTRKGYGGKNAMVIAEVYHMYSSSNARVGAVLFRIKNTTEGAIGWLLQFRYTCYANWSERASVTLNGADSCNSVGVSSGVNNSVAVNLSIPPDRTSTVIVVSTSDATQLVANNIQIRTLILAFINDSLELPAGLEYVDDLASATGGWEQ